MVLCFKAGMVKPSPQWSDPTGVPDQPRSQESPFSVGGQKTRPGFQAWRTGFNPTALMSWLVVGRQGDPQALLLADIYMNICVI